MFERRAVGCRKEAIRAAHKALSFAHAKLGKRKANNDLKNKHNDHISV